MTRVTMAMRDDFEDRNTLVSYLGNQLYRGRLSLVLGSGISKPFGLPDWDTLIKNLYDGVGEPVPSDKDATVLAGHFRRQHYKDNPEGFKDAVHAALYKDASAGFAKLRANELLAAFGALVMSSNRGNASEVITFNFDNLLELYLGYHGFVTDAITKEIHWSQPADVHVYHPHGFLPIDPGDTKSENLVLDQLSFSQVVGKNDDIWRQTAMAIFRRRTCLFVGLSGDDPNLDSMLVDAKKVHVSSLENTLYWGVKFATEDDVVDRSRWEERGIHYQLIDDYYADLPSFIFEICQKAADVARKNRT